jgi:leucyl aminopeptidase (aminopeptidase T)
MELDKSLEPTPHWYWIEMGRVGKKIVEEFFPIQPGEHVVVTADTSSDWRAVEEVVKAVYAVGATPTLVVHPTTSVATAEPPPPVGGALERADAWIEMNNDGYLLYSDAWKKAMAAGVRYFTLGGDADSLIRMVGRVDYHVLDSLANKLVELSNRAAVMRITSEQGTNLRLRVNPGGSTGHVLKGGTVGFDFEGTGTTQVPPGQSSVGHLPGSVEGILVFDGTIYPPTEIGVLRDAVRLEIEKGKIVKITGGREARQFEQWLKAWNHPGMFEIAHCTYGFNPGVTRCKGEIGHDERVFGCMEFGIGAAWAEAPAHTDGVVLQPSVWADDVQLEQDGRYVHPELAQLARQLGVAGY